MFFGILFAICACQDSNEPITTESNTLCVYNESDAIDNLINSLDSLNLHYQMYARSGADLQHELDPRDSLNVIPAWVDIAGGLVWGHYGWDIGAAAGALISGGNAGASIASGLLLGLTMHELGSAFASSLAQAIMNCSGYAMVSNPGYLDPSWLDFLPPLKTDNPILDDGLYKAIYDSLGYRHNVILSEMSKCDMESQIMNLDYDNCFQLCLDKYNNLLLDDSIQICVSDDTRRVIISYVSELCDELIPALRGDRTYTEFIDSTCGVISRNLEISEEKIGVLKEFNSKALLYYCNMDKIQRVNYAGDIEKIVRESTISSEMKNEIMLETTIGFNSANYWTFDEIED